jgi:long-chain acyl-CoA synthetase
MQARPWHNSYPPYVPHEIVLDDNETLLSVLERSLARYAERTAATCAGETLTYAELDRLSSSFAAYLQQAGIAKGDRLAIMLPNGLPFLVAIAAALRTGAALVAVNPLYTPREVAHQLKDSGARCVVVSEHLVSTLWQVLPHTSIEHIVRVQAGGFANARAQLASGPDNVPDTQAATTPHPDQGITLASAIEIGSRHHREQVRIEPADIAFLQYTGGTTGTAKGAVLTHRSLCASLAQNISWSGFAMKAPGASVVTPLPLYHIYPMAVSLAVLALGVNNRLIPDPRNTAALISELKRQPFDLFLAVNTLFNSLSGSPELKSVDFSRTRMVIGSGAPVQSAVAQRWIDAGGPPITEVYGLTEMSPIVSFNLPGQSGTIGVPVPSTDVMVADDQGRPVPTGEVGELLVKGPQMFAGYWNREEETHQAFTADGWFRTGDVVRMREDGYMSLVDRKKDMFLVSGFNVYPNEIEAVAMMLPDVQECACIGVPDERSGEACCLFVVPRHLGVTLAQVESHCRANLAAYKVPRHISIIETLPKSAAGKVLRKDLRHQYDAGSR